MNTCFDCKYFQFTLLIPDYIQSRNIYCKPDGICTHKHTRGYVWSKIEYRNHNSHSCFLFEKLE